MQCPHKNKVFAKQQSLDPEENNILQINSLEQDLIDLGFQTGQIIFQPKIKSSKGLMQTIVIKDHHNKPIHVQLNAETFRKVKLYVQQSQLQPNQLLFMKIQNQQETICKICLEKSNSEQFVKPCQCKGSVQYVHEDCLKTWLLRNHKIDEIRANRVCCELCKATIKCEVFFQSQYMFTQLFRIQQSQRCCLISFLVIGLLLFGIGILLASTLGENNFKVAFIIGMVLCFFCGIIIFLLLLAFILEIANVVSISSWKILDNSDSLSNVNRVKGQRSIKKSSSVPVFTIKEDFMIKTLTKQQTSAIQVFE